LASQVDKSLLLNELSLQRANRIHIAILHGINVPSGGKTVAVGVEEDNRLRKVVIVVN
jgi:hypothetical protein